MGICMHANALVCFLDFLLHIAYGCLADLSNKFFHSMQPKIISKELYQLINHSQFHQLLH
ncbi:hypothetical protein T4B_3524 [Trichinella pseudospiralis]|uniref:Uncharacterized protein n=1 Tax=Trichinella pseudospiralis TaxID=6337 RepID=A0A0V1JJR8_TRIPS|nr:hypothetical protein T4B_3524 [Trichinella pseudospiralis]KRZ35222.1 hypothetical protein T4C_491 [Trichinella pseudospiralis]